MRAAPAVSVICSRAGAWRGAQALLPGLAAAALVAWALGHLQRPAWPALFVAVPVAVLAWRRARPQAVTLAWDGQRWHADGCPGSLQLMIDLGPWMLLRLRPDDPARPAVWIPVSAADAGAARHALCAAVHSGGSKPAPGAGVAEHGSTAKAD